MSGLAFIPRPKTESCPIIFRETDFESDIKIKTPHRSFFIHYMGLPLFSYRGLQAMAGFILVILLIPWILRAQPKQGQALIDSLVSALDKAGRDKQDSLKADILIELCYNLYNMNPSQGIAYGKQGLEIAERLRNKSQAALACYNLGANFCVAGDYPHALEYWMRSLTAHEELGDSSGAANCLMNIGKVYMEEKKYEQAQDNYSQALAIYEKGNDKEGVALVEGEIGSAYLEQEDYSSALKYHRRALAENTKLGNKERIATSTGNIAIALMGQGAYHEALTQYFLAARMYEQIEDKNNYMITMGNIGECYLRIATDTARRAGPGRLIPIGRKANLEKAVLYLRQCLALAGDLQNQRSLQSYSKVLSEAEELLGNYQAALEYYKRYSNVKDSIFNIENNIKIHDLETKRKLDLKQKDVEINEKKIALDKLEIAKNRNERAYFIAGLLLLSAIIVVISNNYRIKNRSNIKLHRINSLLSTEKEKSDDLLRNILPHEVAEELKATGGARARSFDNVTVLFTDFVDFTETGERRTPQELVDELDICFKAFDEVTDKYHIEKIKTIGDAYLAVAGLPAPDPQHAVHVIQAAMEINSFMKDRKASMDTFEIRIGVHTGTVVAGIVGVKKFAYDIWGDTVNTAARMQECSEPGRINISEITYELVKDHFTCNYRGHIDAKGKGKMNMYFVD
jgi:class 3 adenylate cyclase